MAGQPTFHPGGYVPTEGVRVYIHPDECIVRFEGDRVVCVRASHQDRTCSRRPDTEGTA